MCVRARMGSIESESDAHLGYREEDAGDESLAVIWLLENGNLLSKSRPRDSSDSDSCIAGEGQN